MADNRFTQLRIVADVGVLAVFTAAFIVALDFPYRSARYPLVVCAIGACLAAVNLLWDLTEVYRSSKRGHEPDREQQLRAWVISGSLLGFVVIVGVFGMLVGTALWLPLILRFLARMTWPSAVLDMTIVVAVLFGLERIGLGSLPSGLLL